MSFCSDFFSLSSLDDSLLEVEPRQKRIRRIYLENAKFHRILLFSSMEWHTQWLVKLFYCHYFSVHIYMIRLTFLVSFRHFLLFVSTESWCQNVESTLFVSSKADFCETLLLTFNRFYQSFDKVAIQIFWHHLLIKMRPGLILGSHWSWTCIILCLGLRG